MSWMQLKMFAISRAKFKGDDDADARWTAIGFTFPPAFCWRRAGCEMKRCAYSLRRSARRVESQAGSPTPPALLSCSFPYHSTLTRSLAARARILNQQPTRDFNAQLLAPVHPPPPQAPQTEQLNIQHLRYCFA